MKSFDYDAVVYDGACYCCGCLEKACKAPEGYEHQQVTLDSDEVSPIFADSEWDSYPVCCYCGEIHDYISLTDDGWIAEAERQHAEIFHVPAGEFVQSANSGDGTWHEEYMSNAGITEESTAEEIQLEADALAGYYVWCCLPGCMPEGEAMGPYKTKLDAAKAFLD